MNSLNPQLGLISKEKRQSAIDEIINFFRTERSEDIGVIAAEEVLDFFLEEIGKTIYNKGVKDARNILEQRLSDFGIDLEALILDEPSSRNRV